MQRIGIVHRHDPAADVALGARLKQLPAANQLTDAMIDIAEVKLGAFIRACICHFVSPVQVRALARHIDQYPPADLAGNNVVARLDSARQISLVTDQPNQRPVKIAVEPGPGGHARTLGAHDGIDAE